MKNAIRILALTFLFTLVFSLNAALAQPHPGEQGNGGNAGGAPIAGAGAPIGSGEIFLLAFAALYAGRKVYVIGKLQPVKV